MTSMPRWAGFFTIFLGVTLWCTEYVTARVCYYGQEADTLGNLHWVMPGKDHDGCSCTEIRPGGVNLVRHTQLDEDGGREFKDKPLFTQNQESIHQYFNCKDFPDASSGETATKAGTPTKTAYPPTTKSGLPTTTASLPNTADRSATTADQTVGTTAPPTSTAGPPIAIEGHAYSDQDQVPG